MKINWQSHTPLTSKEVNRKIELEFSFRQKMSRFLVQHNNLHCCDDFACYVFDYFVEEESIKISAKTPEPHLSNLRRIWHVFEQKTENRD